MKYPKMWKVSMRHRETGEEKTVLVDWTETSEETRVTVAAWWPEYEVTAVRYEPPVKPSRQELEARRTRRLAARRERDADQEESDD
jgi:hypothetical protein